MSALNAPPSIPVTLLDFRHVVKGSLRGFCKVRIGKALVIHDVAVMVSRGKAWAKLPGKPQIDAAGVALRDDAQKFRYVPVLEWSDRESADKFSASVIEAVRLHHPDALVNAA